MNYGYGLKQIREALDLDTIDFADKCGVTPGTIFKIEENCEDINKPELKGILQKLDMDNELYILLCCEKTDVPEHKWSSYDLLIPVMKEIIILLLSDPAEDHEPIHNQEEMSAKLDELIVNLKSLTS